MITLLEKIVLQKTYSQKKTFTKSPGVCLRFVIFSEFSAKLESFTFEPKKNKKLGFI